MKHRIGDPMAPIIVSRNLLREQLNDIKIREYAKRSNNTLFMCPAVDRLVKNGENILLKKRVNSMIGLLEEKDTENLMTNLPLVHKAKYFLTKNLAVKNGLVNGTEVELHSVCLENDSIVNINDNHVLNQIPKYLLVKKLTNNCTNNLLFDHLDKDLIPIFPQTSSFYVKPKCDALGTKSVTVSRTNFPLTPSYALTAYKAQGKTLGKVIVDLCKPPIGRLDFAYCYVALSRAKSLKDILILRPFDKKCLCPKISGDYFVEIERLNTISV